MDQLLPTVSAARGWAEGTEAGMPMLALLLFTVSKARVLLDWEDIPQLHRMEQAAAAVMKYLLPVQDRAVEADMGEQAEREQEVTEKGATELAEIQ